MPVATITPTGTPTLTARVKGLCEGRAEVGVATAVFVDEAETELLASGVEDATLEVGAAEVDEDEDEDVVVWAVFWVMLKVRGVATETEPVELASVLEVGLAGLGSYLDDIVLL